MQLTKLMRERYHLLRFQECCRDFPEGTCIFGDKPDLIVQTRDGNVGIEHTQLFAVEASANTVVPQEQECLQDRVVARAKEIHDERSGPMLWLYVDFNQHVPLTKRSVKDVATRLAHVMKLSYHLPVTDEWMEIPRWRYERRYSGSFPSQIDNIRFQVVDKPGWVLWGVPRSFMVPRITSERIQAEINKKEIRLATYDRACAQMWLLLVSSGGVPSSHFSMLPEVAAHEYQTCFNRVFYFENFKGEVLELNIKR